MEEWTQLVRSRLVLGQTQEAQIEYDAARAAYPDATQRTELDRIARDGGLVEGTTSN
jgi:cytochrome c-type biogenesis protein CcmH